MIKKVLYLVLFLLSITSIVLPQEISELRILGKAELLPEELIDKNVVDANGIICAGVIIESDLTGLTFQSSNGIVKVNHSAGKDFLFLSPDERMIQVFCSGFKPIKIILVDQGIALKSGEVWQIKITGDKKRELISIIVNVKPGEAKITFDEKVFTPGKTIQAAEGKHKIKIEMEGYRTILDSIPVNSNNILFSYILEQIEPVLVKFNSIPGSARLYVDNIDKGETEKELFLFPGKYNVKMLKAGYFDFEKEIEVKEKGDNSFTFTLSKNSAVLKINITPADAKILLNKEDYTGRADFELAPGKYKVEIQKEGYTGIDEIINLELGKPLTKNYVLTQKTGKLQFTVQPGDAEAELLKNNEAIEKWTGAKYFKEVGTGNYILYVHKDGYERLNKEIKIDENETTVQDIVLKETNMVFIRGGEFTMGGSDGGFFATPHKVKLSDFYISKFELTIGEFEEFINATNYKTDADKEGWSYVWGTGAFTETKGVNWRCGSDGKLRGENEKNYPVIFVSWNDAVAYCEWLSKKEGKHYRLPTEAEWEYAAKGGSKSKGYKYSGSNNIDEVGWYWDNSERKIQTVGAKKPNELGLYDMTGNVTEWCSDWYEEDYYKISPLENPKGPVKGTWPVVRGGSILIDKADASVEERNWFNSRSLRYSIGGFRCVMDLEKAEVIKNKEVGKQANCPPTVSYAGTTYHTVMIGKQCWFKENLNVGVMIPDKQNQTKNGIIEKYCYNNDSANCLKYGGLYKWNEAMQYITVERAQGICPEGWHIPTRGEFTALKSLVGSNGNSLKETGEGAEDGIGTNKSGFSALLGGYHNYKGGFLSINSNTYFWSSTVRNSSLAYLMLLNGTLSNVDTFSDNMNIAFSVRCLKDQ